MKIVKVLLAVLSFSIFISGCQKDPEAFIENKPPTVFAGRDTTVELIKSFSGLQLSGSANDTDGLVTGYLWSQYAGPNQSAIVSPASAATIVNGLTTGDYVFQLMAVDNDGATGLNFVSVKVIVPHVFIDTLNIKNNPTETVINSREAGNNATLQELPPSYWTNSGTSVETRALLKFDFSRIPAGATVTSAKLSLYAVPNPLNGDGVRAHYGSNNAVYIKRITANWNTSSLTWSNQPATSLSNQVELPATSDSFKDYPNLDVTKMVQDMVANGNYGMLLQLKNIQLYNIQNFASSKHADSSKHPKLIVEYTK